MVDASKPRNLGILNQKYQLIRFLGEGTTSKVYLANRLEDGFQLAIKLFKPEFLNSGSEARQIFIDELTALASLNHPNIVKMYEYSIDGSIEGSATNLSGLWYIALEYISETTLVDLVQDESGLDEEIAKQFFYQMIQTLTYINSKGISHRDIKLENMLVNENCQLKFADFGFASFSKDQLTQQKGTPIYIAPEILAQQPYIGEDVDVFSLGVVLFAMVAGKYPFQWAHISDKKYQFLIQKQYTQFWKPFERECIFSESLKDLIQNMLAYNPKDRIKVNDIANHEWFNEFTQMTMDELKNELLKKKVKQNKAKNTRKRGTFRGTLISGERGGTCYDDSVEEINEFKITKEVYKAYNFDKREIQLADMVTPTQVVESIQELVSELNDAGKPWELKITDKPKDSAQPQKTVLMKLEKKNIEFKVKFITYVSEDADNEELNSHQLYVRFEKKQGLTLNFYKYIDKIRAKLDECSLID